MQFDQELAHGLATGVGSPTLRFYRWQPWAISLGHNQDVSDLDLEKCAQRGIEIVRRPTGGRAILHAEELTYSVVMYSNDAGVLDVYHGISRALIVGLRLFGVDALLQRSQPDFPKLYRRTSAVPCFASSAKYEIEWNGRKLVGSAQRRYRDKGREVVLQHGSILTGSAHQQLADFLMMQDSQTTHQLEIDLREKTTDISAIRGCNVDMDELVRCIQKGFEMEWGVTFSPQETLFHPQTHSYA